MAWTPRSDHPVPSAPDRQLSPERPSCCLGLGLQRKSTSDMSPSSSPGRCRVPAHLGPAGREASRGPAAAGGRPSWWPPVAGGLGREAQGRPGSRGSSGGRVTAFIGLEDCTTAHTNDVKGGVQGQGEILINNPSPQALSCRGVTWTRVSLGCHSWIPSSACRPGGSSSQLLCSGSPQNRSDGVPRTGVHARTPAARGSGSGEVAPGGTEPGSCPAGSSRIRPLGELRSPRGAPDFTLVPHKSRAVAFPPTFRDGIFF